MNYYITFTLCARIFLMSGFCFRSKAHGNLTAVFPFDQEEQTLKILVNIQCITKNTTFIRNTKHLTGRDILPPLMLLFMHAVQRHPDRIVGIATGYGLDDQGIEARVTTGSRIFFLHVLTGSGVQATSYPVGIGGSFPSGKTVGA
jgi:hypothetical protein